MSTSVEIIRGKHIKQNDTLPNLIAQLFEQGDAFNLDGYTVSMKMKKTEDDDLTVDSSVTIESESKGIITYDWNEGETKNDGTYIAEFIVNDGTDRMTFPNSGYSTIYIEQGVN